MKKLSTTLLLALAATAVACGYSSKATTPAVAGAMPSIAQLSPNTTTSGAAGFTMTVNGTNFSSTAVVNWNGGPLTTTYISASQVMAAVAATDIATPATVPVTVTNPGHSGGGAYGSGGTLAETSAATNFTVN
jgi:hypothetical protein